MDTPPVPGDVETALAHVGYRAVAVGGPDRCGWLAVALDGSGSRLELHVLDAVVDDALVARVDRLRGVRHDHLARLLDATELSPGRVGLFVEHVEGLSLAQIRSARAPLTDGEAATVAIPVAGALGALHVADLAHGAVHASTIVVRPDGRPALLDLRGAVTGAADPVSDVSGLVAVILEQLPDEDVHLMAASAQLRLRDALVDQVATPGIDAARLVECCFGAAEPEAVQLPDAGALASSALLSSARQPQPERGRRDERSAVRRRRGRLAALAVACAAAVAIGLVGWRLATEPAGPPSALTNPHEPVAAAVELSRVRAAVVAAGDVGGLGAVEVPNGPAHTADLALLAGLGPGSADGLTVDVQDAWLVPDPGTRGGTTDVAVTASMSAASPAPSAEARTVVLGLRWTDDGWRVWDVTAPG